MKPTILLVDDNQEILDFIADDLKEHYAVITAASGSEALNILEQDCVQLVVSDVMMPDIDGFELCGKIKSTFNFSHIPVIMLTAKNTLESKIAGLELGADAYIEKPHSPKYLRVQIENLLANRTKIKEYFANSPLSHIKTIAHSKQDENFLEHLNEVILSNLNNVTLDVDYLAKNMNVSRPTLYRKIKAVSNLTPNELINITRLKKAAEWLAGGSYKIYEIAEMAGFSSQSNFGRCFHKQFGITPTDYQSTKKREAKNHLKNETVY
jgi:two-component system cell cycle response regulator